MFIIPNYTIAVGFCIITMLCWGSWANTQKLAAKTWRFELFYWDYVWGILLSALLIAFTLAPSGSREGRLYPICCRLIGQVSGRRCLEESFLILLIFYW